MKRDMIVSLEW